MTPSNTNATTRTLIVAALTVLAAATRLLPHPFNFSPTTAILLLGAAYAGNRALGFAIPLLLTFLIDVLLNNTLYAQFHKDEFTLFYEGAWVVYGAYGLMYLLGLGALRGRAGLLTIGSTTLASTLLFFLVTNLPMGHVASLYPKTFDGMVQSYTAALPFLRHAFVGDLFFTYALFACYELVKRYAPARLALA